MIVVHMMGNIGNQMFIYAMARALQLEYKDALTIDLSGLKRNYYTAVYKLDKFKLTDNINYNIEKLGVARKIKYKLSSKIFHLQHYYYRKTREDLMIPQRVCNRWFKRGCYYCTNRLVMDYPRSDSKDKYVYGYFQAEKYFKKYSDVIRKEFRLKDAPSKEEAELIEKMKDKNSVAVSIRANKTPENPKVKDNVNLGFINKDFYYRGMDEIAKKVSNPVFYIFADDLDIVKKEFDFKYEVRYVMPEDSASGIRLMYSCKHYVIANSTFSWWGAYLGDASDKIVVMPKPWDRVGAERSDIYFGNPIKLSVNFID